MNRKTFDQVVKDTIKSTADLLIIKGDEYSDDDDKLSNFKRGSERIGITSLQVALIYASKHFDSTENRLRGRRRDFVVGHRSGVVCHIWSSSPCLLMIFANFGRSCRPQN